MRDVSLRLLSGILALRRFTADELAAYAEVDGETARTWLRRHPALVKAADPGIAPGDRPMHAVRDRALLRLRAIMAAIPASTLQAAYDGFAGAPARLAALDHAVAYARMLPEAVDAADVAEVRSRLAGWVAAARRQADGFARAGCVVVPEDLALLGDCERVALGHGDAGSGLAPGA